jgi:hypothetical protein
VSHGQMTRPAIVTWTPGRCAWSGGSPEYIRHHDEEWSTGTRPDPVRIPDPRRRPSGPKLVDNPQQTGRLSKGIRRFRCRKGRPFHHSPDYCSSQQ